MGLFSPNSERRTIAAQGNSAYGRYLAANPNRGFDWRYAAPVAGIAALPAIGALAAGSGAAAGAGSVNGLAITPYAGSVAASGTGAATGGGMTLGRILGSRGFDTVANGVTSWLGNRAQNKANRYATDANTALMSRQIAMEQERIKAQQDADAADRVDATRRFDAEEAFKAKQFAASEEERAYTRKLLDDREARRAVFRPYSERAMRSLGAILGIG